jgi:predicted neuraminidase
MAMFAGRLAGAEPIQIESQSGYSSAGFIYEAAPFPSCHASTLIEIPPTGLLAAWFGGTDEGRPDVTIWAACYDGAKWSKPVEVADGVDGDGKRYPCWNPVLFRRPEGELLLFYKVGPSPSRWWGLLKRSHDDGQTWTRAEQLPPGFFGPIRNKPVLLKDGTLLCGSSTEHAGWRVQMERSTDFGAAWEKTDPLNDGRNLGLIQPTILTRPDGNLQILCRSRQQAIFESISSDAGRTWTTPRKTELPNPNSGIDGVTLQDGRQLLVYNHTVIGRSPLNVAVSGDGSKWQAALVLENVLGEFSYPAVIQSADKLVHVTYTWNRKKIRHVVLDPARLVVREMPDGIWPK